MLKKIFIVIFLVSNTATFSQFQFSGKVNENYSNATAFLSIVDDCNKRNLFLMENILQESAIDANNEFVFKGDFLSKNNQIYKIHIDNCNENVSNYKHLLNHCEDSKEIFFIANNKDRIYFPLNDLSQIFCDIDYSKTSNVAIFKIEALQEELLSNLQHSKSDLQRQNVYKNHFKKLQEYSQTFKEPLAELYAFYLYANDNSISKEYYLQDLKLSSYYNSLKDRLTEKYPNTKYLKQFKRHINVVNYQLKPSSTSFKGTVFGVFALVLILIGYAFLQSKKRKSTVALSEKKIQNYKLILTNQEQKVFELMQDNTNKEIGNILFISISTVKTHINNIYSKLNINSRKEIDKYFK